MEEALYTVEFGDVELNGVLANGGVIVLETNRLFGGDSFYYYVGRYEVKDGEFTADAEIVNHNPTFTRTAFGDMGPRFQAHFEGRVGSDGVLTGTMTRADMPGIALGVRLTLQATLP